MKRIAVISLMTIALFLPLTQVLGDRTVTINSFETGHMKNLPTSGDYNAIAHADADGDGNEDMAFGGDDYGSANTQGLYVYRGFGNGTWQSASTGLPTSDSWGGVAFADADGDGKIELYAGNEGWGSYSGTIRGVGAWEYSSGSWSTTGITSPYTSGNVNDLKVLNFTKGPGLDIAFTHSNRDTKGIKVYYGSGSSPITWTANSNGLPTTGEYTGIDIADINNDGLPDLAAGSYSSAGLKIYTQNAAGNGWTDRSSSLPSTYQSGNVDSVVLGDVDNDGNVDILFSRSNGGLKLLLGNGGGTTGTSFTWTDVSSNLPSALGSSRFFQITFKDIDGDGDLDLLAPKQSRGLHLFLGNGTVAQGTNFRFTQVTDKGLPTTGTYVGAAFLDFDNDGVLDIAGSTWGSGVKVYRSNFTIIDTANEPPKPRISGGGSAVLGSPIYLSGTTSSDPEDAPSGDPTGTLLSYNWNLTRKPGASALDDASFSPNDQNASVKLTLDAEGIFNITLAVRDGKDKWSNKGDEATITVSGTNTAPVPDAGNDTSVMLGHTVHLNGTGSYDPDGHDVLFDWNVTSYPPGSLIRDGSLSPSDKVSTPYFVPDVPGEYILTLSVKDSFGKWSNTTDEVSIQVIKPNEPPVARAGKSFAGVLNTTITLNGTGSYDPDGTIIEFNWTCDTHDIEMFNRTTATPSFIPLEAGTYGFSLIVMDDNLTLSEPSEVHVTVVRPGENLPPTADAGYDSVHYEGDMVELDGSGSYDLDGHIVTWDWSCISHQDMVLTNANTSSPSIVLEDPDIYLFSLRVMDNLSAWSKNDTVRVTILAVHVNEPPVANAGRDMTVNVSETVLLDGSASFDPDGAIDFYIWNCTTHEVEIYDSDGAHPYFTPASPGPYSFTLVVVDDEGASSPPDMVNVTVMALPDPPPEEPENVTPAIGPFLYEDGVPMQGARVTLTSGSLSFSAITDASGNVLFSQGVPPGNYTVSASIEGEEVISPFQVWVRDDGSVTYTTGPIPRAPVDDPLGPEPEDPPEKGFPYLIALLLGLAVLMVIVVLAVSFLLFSKRAKEDVEDNICPECGSVMERDQDFDAYRCPSCAKGEE
ncbi:MAG: PKD domain-containing protein [Candidatus Thermoplasmatota archaeon]|nr:PKD domain-containing protein [Candidatus Thermoplasmatota archaeon]